MNNPIIGGSYLVQLSSKTRGIRRALRCEIRIEAKVGDSVFLVKVGDEKHNQVLCLSGGEFGPKNWCLIDTKNALKRHPVGSRTHMLETAPWDRSYSRRFSSGSQEQLTLS